MKTYPLLGYGYAPTIYAPYIQHLTIQLLFLVASDVQWSHWLVEDCTDICICAHMECTVHKSYIRFSIVKYSTRL